MAINIILEDCITGMSKLPDESVDCVVTSPPYNLGTKYEAYDDQKSWDDYLSLMRNMCWEVSRILKPDGSFFLNLGYRISDPLKPLFVVWNFEEAGYVKIQNIIHWVKSISLDDMPCKGHMKPVNSPRFLNNAHEYIFHLTKARDVTLDRLSIGVPYADKTNIKRWKGNIQDVRCRGNVWYIPYETVQKKKMHPASFPIKLPEMCIKLAGIKDRMLVLDPFSGSGATALACKRLGVSFIGFEIDEYYYKRSLELLSAAK
jgi:site-specific DNA-methyltransferase (adenine-specific)